MKRLLVSACAIVLVAAVAVAGEVYARYTTTMGTATNVSWTVGKYDRPTIQRVDIVGQYPVSTTNIVVLTYGDDAAGSRLLGTILADASGSGSLLVTNNAYAIAADVLRVGGDKAGTNAAIRVHYVQRDTRTAN